MEDPDGGHGPDGPARVHGEVASLPDRRDAMSAEPRTIIGTWDAESNSWTNIRSFPQSVSWAQSQSVSWAQSHSLSQPDYPFPVTCEPCSIAAGQPVSCRLPSA